MPARMELELVWQLHDALNLRDIEAALCVLHDDVIWLNGSANGLRGHEALRSYWSERWSKVRPTTRALDCRETSEGLSVAVHEIVWALDTNLVEERYFHHVHSFEAGLVRRVEIHPFPSIAPPIEDRIADAPDDIPTEDKAA